MSPCIVLAAVPRLQEQEHFRWEHGYCHSRGGRSPRGAWREGFVLSGSTNTCVQPAEGCALCVPRDLCMDLTVGCDVAESLWVLIKGQGSKVGVYYKPLSQEDDTVGMECCFCTGY